MKADQVIYSNRKTYAVIVKRDGRVIVRAPHGTTQDQISALLGKKEAWIQQKQALAKVLYEPAAQKEYVNGEGFLYLGKSNQLVLVEEQDVPLVLSDRFYLAKSNQADAERIFTEWYKTRAQEIFTERAAWYAAKHGFTFRQVKIMDARTRWGSCGPKGSLNFSWRLIMAPMRVIDYMVAHELVHLQEKNHSRAYWDRLQTILPDYQQQIAWLERYGQTLTITVRFP